MKNGPVFKKQSSKKVIKAVLFDLYVAKIDCAFDC